MSITKLWRDMWAGLRADSGLAHVGATSSGSVPAAAPETPTTISAAGAQAEPEQLPAQGAAAERSSGIATGSGGARTQGGAAGGAAATGMQTSAFGTTSGAASLDSRAKVPPPSGGSALAGSGGDLAALCPAQQALTSAASAPERVPGGWRPGEDGWDGAQDARRLDSGYSW